MLHWKRWTAAALEMAAIAIALNTFGLRLSGRRIRIHSDSATSVSAISRQASSSSLLMRILRGAHAIAVHYDFHIQFISHVAGAHNVRADAASRMSVRSHDQQSSPFLLELGMSPDNRVPPSVPAWLISLASQERWCVQASASARDQ
jgi:hypothetical protein